MNTEFYMAILKGREHLENLGVDGRIILTDLKEVGYQELYWINPARDRKQWRAPVETMMNICILYKAGNFLISLAPINFSQKTVLREAAERNFGAL